MEEFLKDNYSILTKSVEILAAIAGLICLKKYKATATKYLIYYLVYVAFIELVGTYPRYLIEYEWLASFRDYLKGSLIEKNYWWYTIFWKIGGVLFLTFYYRKILSNSFQKHVLKYVSLGFLLVAVIWYGFNYKTLFYENAQLFITILGTSIILVCVVFYFIEVLQSEKILHFYKSINFYVSAVILIWWLIITPLTFYNIYFTASDWSFIFLQWQIFLAANMFMYLMFTFALLWCKPEND